MKNGKSNFGFSYTYIKYAQILKRFAGTFRQAQTLKLGGVQLEMLLFGSTRSIECDDIYLLRSLKRYHWDRTDVTDRKMKV